MDGMADRPLTPKQEAFVREYLSNGRNGAAAYRVAYNEDAPPQRAAEEACKLLGHPKIAPRIGAVAERVEQRTEVTVARVRQELARVAFSDPRKLYNADGSLKPPSEWDDDTAASIAGVEVFEEFERDGRTKKKVGETRKVKRWDKNRALDSLAKHLDMYGDGDRDKSRPSITFVEIVMPAKEPKAVETVDAAPPLSPTTTIEVVHSARSGGS
jgi:phage terminase small subunit